MSTPSAIISYSHDSDEHRERVLHLAQELRKHGIDCTLDRFVDPTDWAAWMESEVRERQWVLVAATETYLRRTRGEEPVGVGLGASWEYSTVRQALYGSRGDDPKFVPIIFTANDAQYIPDALKGRTHYNVSDAADLTRLMNKLAGLPITVEPVPLGPIKQLDVVSKGMTSFPAMIEIVKPRPALCADPTIKPRLYANVSVSKPGFIAVGNRPVTKLGAYRLKVEIENKGKGAANKVRISVTGVGAITKLGTIAPKEKVRTYFIDIENEPAYQTAQPDPAITVECLDDDGAVYRQVGPLQTKSTSGKFLYEGGNLEAPELVEAPQLAY